MNLVVAVFIAFLLLIVAVGVPCTLDAKWIPQSVKEMYVYGKPTKLIGKKSPILTKLVRLIQVPKRYKWPNFICGHQNHSKYIIFQLVFTFLLVCFSVLFSCADAVGAKVCLFHESARTFNHLHKFGCIQHIITFE